MKLRTLILGVLMFAILWFLGWEAWAVHTARQKTEAIFAPYRDPAALPLTWSDLSPWQRDVLIRVEDPAFWSHRGIDISTPGAGITTITQALAKRLYFEKFTPGFAKIEQSLIAVFVIDPVVDKTTQINTFLAVAYLGEGIIGFEAAARAHFGRPAAALGRDDFIALVASLIGPNRFAPGTAENAARAARIARLLAGDCRPAGNRDVYYDACGGPAPSNP